MAFREKSAWIMFVALLIAGTCYFASVASIWQHTGRLQATLPLLVVSTVAIVVLSIVGHVVIAIFAPKDANAPADERERLIIIRAGHYSSYVLAFGLITSLGYYLVLRDGDLLFYAAFASLMLAQITEYALTIFLYRTT